MVDASPFSPAGRAFDRWSRKSQRCRHADFSRCIAPLRSGSGPWFDGTVSTTGPLLIQNHRHDQDHGNARQHTASVSLPVERTYPAKTPREQRSLMASTS